MRYIEKFWQWLKRKRPVYTTLPQGKTSSAVKPLAQYRWRPRKQQQ